MAWQGRRYKVRRASRQGIGEGYGVGEKKSEGEWVRKDETLGALAGGLAGKGSVRALVEWQQSCEKTKDVWLDAPNRG